MTDNSHLFEGSKCNIAFCQYNDNSISDYNNSKSLILKKGSSKNHEIVTVNKEKEKSTKSTPKRRDPYSAKVLKDDLIPEDLKECTELFVEWWSARHKKGATCSSKIAEREFSKLRAWSKVNRISALQKAIYKPWMQLYAVTDAQAAETAPSAPRLKDFTGAAAKMRAEQNNNPLAELF